MTSRPSAALVIGGIAGVLSAMLYLLMIVPLVWEIIRAEQVLGRSHTTAAALSIHHAFEQGMEPSARTAHDHGIGVLAFRSGDGEWVSHGHDFPSATWMALCPVESTERSEIVATSSRQQWAVSCVRRGDLLVSAGMKLDPQAPARRLFLRGVLLALFVGIVTALGIVRLMQPLSDISRALQRVGGGERGVTASSTGLAELDLLVDRLNAAARYVDEREDAIVSRVALVQEMTRIVAHEIRNPLQSVELLTNLVVAEADEAERRQMGDAIRSEVRTLEQVVNRMLRETAARGSLRLQMTRQSVAPIVEHVVALRRPQAQAAGVRIYAAPLSQTELVFDQMLVKRSIENLVLNALQAVPRGQGGRGPGRGAAGEPTSAGEIRISVVDEAEYLRITVEDNGPGVPSELIPHVFEPNVSGRPDGTGLGLALVKGVVEAHNGYIEYGGSALGGARFEVRIPLRPPAEPVRLHSVDPPEPGGRLT